jgi:hypothetical protein
VDIQFLLSGIARDPGSAVVQEKRIIATMQVMLISNQRCSTQSVPLVVNNHAIDTLKRISIPVRVPPFFPEHDILIVADADYLGTFCVYI